MLHAIFVNNYFITDLQSDKSKKTYFSKIKGQQNGKLSIIINFYKKYFPCNFKRPFTTNRIET